MAWTNCAPWRRAGPVPFAWCRYCPKPRQDAGWAGARGLVTDQLPQVVEPGMHAYLCGPPAMVDAAHAALVAAGLARAHIHADRFVTQKELSAPKRLRRQLWKR